MRAGGAPSTAEADCGVKVPRWVAKEIDAYRNDSASRFSWRWLAATLLVCAAVVVWYRL